MSELLPNYKWSEISKLPYEALVQLPCCEIVDGDNTRTLGVFLVVPSTDFIKAVTDDRGLLSNSLLSQPLARPGDFIKADEPAPLYVSDKPPKRKKRKK